MSDTKHTPGPWHVGMRPGPMVYGPSGEQAADLTANLLPRDTRAANARLIAAAPDLLEALRFIVNDAPKGEDAELTVEGYNRACAAIARAEGR